MNYKASFSLLSGQITYRFAHSLNIILNYLNQHLWELLWFKWKHMTLTMVII